MAGTERKKDTTIAKTALTSLLLRKRTMAIMEPKTMPISSVTAGKKSVKGRCLRMKAKAYTAVSNSKVMLLPS